MRIFCLMYNSGLLPQRLYIHTYWLLHKKFTELQLPNSTINDGDNMIYLSIVYCGVL